MHLGCGVVGLWENNLGVRIGFSCCLASGVQHRVELSVQKPQHNDEDRADHHPNLLTTTHSVRYQGRNSFSHSKS